MTIAKIKTKLALRIVDEDEKPDELTLLRQELEALKAQGPAPKESRDQIALRLRSGIGPVRPMVERCLVRPDDPKKERWI